MAELTGIPRGADLTRPRNAFSMMVLEPIERMTTALRRGDPFSETALQDMLAMNRRLDAFGSALRARLKAHGIDDDPLVEAAE
jgi:hypothetical protein